MAKRKKKVAVLGAEGMLGTDICLALKTTGFSVDCYNHNSCDITASKDIAAAVHGHEYIVNCAAFTNVELAENQPAKAYAVNANAVANLARHVDAASAYLLHFSSDFVFDGLNRNPYKESATPHPVNIYGQTKYKGEKMLREVCPDAGILRIQWTYGHAGDNFIKKVIRQSHTASELTVVDDQIGTPTWTKDIAVNVPQILGARLAGLMHYAPQGHASRYEVATFAAKELYLPARIVACKSSALPTQVKRPRNTCFDCSLLASSIDLHQPEWQSSLRKFLKQLQVKSTH